MQIGNGQPSGGGVRIDRPLACFVLAALAMVGAIGADDTWLYLVAVVLLPGLIAAVLARRREWGYSYVANAFASVAGAAVAAATAAAMTDPTQLDSNPLVYMVMNFILVGFLGGIGVTVIGPFSWVARRWFGRR